MPVQISRDPTPYQERRGLIVTERLPQPRVFFPDNIALRAPQAPPYPLPELLRPIVRPANPDSGPIQEWPER